MTAVGRYAGRRGGPGIDDSPAGPQIVAGVFAADAVVIADPLSFPWSLVEAEQWRLPITVDLRRLTMFQQLLGTLVPGYSVSGEVAGLGILIALGVGLVSTLLPAWQVRSLRPVQALRAEG